MFTNLSDRAKSILQVIFVLALVGGAIIFLIAIGALQTSTESHLVYFEVQASGGYAIITLKAGDERIDKPTTVTIPWKKTLRIKSGTEVYLTASNPSQTGLLSCRILLDKTPWKMEEINAPKNGVACAGIVP